MGHLPQMIPSTRASHNIRGHTIAREIFIIIMGNNIRVTNVRTALSARKYFQGEKRQITVYNYRGGILDILSALQCFADCMFAGIVQIHIY